LRAVPPDVAIARLRAMLDDQDKRVVPSAIDGLEHLETHDLNAFLFAQLKTADIGIRGAAARAIGRLKPAGGAAALRDAYRAAESDNSDDVRDAAMTALAAYGATEAMETVKGALADKDWALRLKAAALMKTLDP